MQHKIVHGKSNPYSDHIPDYSNDCPLALLMLIANQTFPVSPSSFIYPPVPPGTPLVVVSLCPGRHLYSQYSGRHLCPDVPVCTFSLSVEVVVILYSLYPLRPSIPVVICFPVSRSVISLRTIPVSRSSFIYLPCTPVVPFVVVSLCPGRHLYSLCPRVPVCNFSLRFPVVIYIPCIPVSRSSFMSRSVISSVDKHDVSRQTIS